MFLNSQSFVYVSAKVRTNTKYLKKSNKKKGKNQIATNSKTGNKSIKKQAVLTFSAFLAASANPTGWKAKGKKHTVMTERGQLHFVKYYI